MKKNGFSLVIVLLLFAVLAILIGGLVFLTNRSLPVNKDKPALSPSAKPVNTGTKPENSQFKSMPLTSTYTGAHFSVKYPKQWETHVDASQSALFLRPKSLVGGQSTTFVRIQSFPKDAAFDSEYEALYVNQGFRKTPIIVDGITGQQFSKLSPPLTVIVLTKNNTTYVINYPHSNTSDNSMVKQIQVLLASVHLTAN